MTVGLKNKTKQYNVWCFLHVTESILWVTAKKVKHGFLGIERGRVGEEMVGAVSEKCAIQINGTAIKVGTRLPPKSAAPDKPENRAKLTCSLPEGGREGSYCHHIGTTGWLHNGMQHTRHSLCCTFGLFTRFWDLFCVLSSLCVLFAKVKKSNQNWV